MHLLWSWLRNFGGRRDAIQEYRAIGRIEADRLAGLEANPLHDAARAVRAGDLVSAASYWEDARVKIPDHVVRSKDALEILLALARFDELEAVLLRARKASPMGTHHILALASLRERQLRFEEAAQHWKALRRRSPTEVAGYLRGAECLCHLKRQREAVTILKAGAKSFPDNWDIWTRLANVTERLPDFPAALKAWDHIANELGLAYGFSGAARVLDAMGDHSSALKRLNDGRSKHPYDRDILVGLARAAERLQSPVDALVYWREIRLVFPRWKDGYEEAARLLSEMGKADEAAEVWTAWNSRFPEQSVLATSPLRPCASVDNASPVRSACGLIEDDDILPVWREESTAQYRVGTGDRIVLSMSGEPISTFLPGWSPGFVYAGLAPIYVLELSHSTGQRAAWFLDDTMAYIGGAPDVLPPATQAVLATRAAWLVQRVWAAMFDVPAQSSLAASSFFRLNDAVRAYVMSHHQAGDSANPIDVASALDAPHRRFAVSTSSGAVMLDSNHLRNTLTRRIADENIRMCCDGALQFPSPVDGRELRTEHGLYLDDNVWAYYLVDDHHGYSFFAVACESNFRTVALYFPRDHLTVCLDDFHRSIVSDRAKDLTARLYAHLGHYGGLLQAYLALPTAGAVHILRGLPVMHIGHTMWNDMAGITHLVNAVPPGSLPAFAVFDAGHRPEIYGPLDRIFPELCGLIRRYEQSFTSYVAEAYSKRLRLLKATTEYVPRSTGTRILAACEAARENAADLEAIAAQRHTGGLAVYVNVRVENRTLADPAAFCETLVDLFAEQRSAVTLIIDGHDRREHGNPDWMYASVGETLAAREPISIEREVVERIRVRAAGTGVTIVSTVGSTVAQSLLWCSSANFFIATWGAALAKCCWVCNRPGLVLSNRMNLLNRNDLHIYSSPDFNEDPAPVRFIDVSAIIDAPDAPAQSPAFQPYSENFHVDPGALRQAVYGMIDDFAGVIRK